MTLNDFVTFYFGTVAGMYIIMLLVSFREYIHNPKKEYKITHMSIFILLYPVTFPIAAFMWYKDRNND